MAKKQPSTPIKIAVRHHEDTSPEISFGDIESALYCDARSCVIEVGDTTISISTEGAVRISTGMGQVPLVQPEAANVVLVIPTRRRN